MALKRELKRTFLLALIAATAVFSSLATWKVCEAKVRQASAAAFYYQQAADKAEQQDKVWRAALVVAEKAVR